MSDNHHHFNYIELPTTNMSDMKAFYTAVFGWDYVDYGPDYAAIIGAGIEGGFDANSDRTPSRDGGLIVIYSDDIAASLEAVTVAGGDISIPIFTFPGGKRFHFIGPSGNELAVWTKIAEP